ncbi:WD-repeat region-domain-containing protein [Linnemannia elongata]|nr:WD-repeat region-domain-containing protein [Linnemannia elongata]
MAMHQFPLLVQWSSAPEIYHGFLSVMDRELEVCIEMPSSGTGKTGQTLTKTGLKNISKSSILSSRIGSLSGSEELKEILSGQETQLQQKMEEAKDMASFLVELVDTLEVIMSNKRAKGDKEKPLRYWTHVMEQLDALGWDRVTLVDQDLSRVQIELCDAAQRKHLITARFPPAYPTIPLTIAPLEIPECEDDQLAVQRGLNVGGLSSKQGSALQAAIRQAEAQLEIFQEFWDVMQDFDERTWVIDPEKPTRADKMRRCALGNHCSIQVTVQPLSPRSMPDTRLFGPTASIEPMRTKLYQNAGLWDVKKLPRENLEVLLELEGGFPSPISTNKDDINVGCGICYSFRFEGQVPDQLCSQAKCQQPFHRVCLYEWLRSVPTTRQSFHTLFGSCPYCGETITTSAPKT